MPTPSQLEVMHSSYSHMQAKCLVKVQLVSKWTSGYGAMEQTATRQGCDMLNRCELHCTVLKRGGLASGIISLEYA